MRLIARMAMPFKLLMLMLLTACGQKGDLYLPDQAPEATMPTVQTTDAEDSSDPSETRKK